ncbi:hypothetical protein A4X03_0g1775 [Tilletia caries]|uniref:Uncharacterized protein n=1 Tax=Tilletia caries TaxID=13290 RepID=A0A177VA26_9BASI|nr:hypothetical protein A4X03_0g1775 [Tilletia caries]
MQIRPSFVLLFLSVILTISAAVTSAVVTRAPAPAGSPRLQPKPAESIIKRMDPDPKLAEKSIEWLQAQHAVKKLEYDNLLAEQKEIKGLSYPHISPEDHKRLQEVMIKIQNSQAAVRELAVEMHRTRLRLGLPTLSQLPRGLAPGSDV